MSDKISLAPLQFHLCPFVNDQHFWDDFSSLIELIDSAQIRDMSLLDYFINHMQNPSTMLPLKFGHALQIRHLDWSDFPGAVDARLPWSAHIFWSIDYRIVDPEKRKVAVNLVISKRSWVRPQKKCDHLLNHEQGHYLIGALCCLQFLRRVDAKRRSHQRFQDLLLQTFDRTLKEFLEVERQYDNQTEHRLNFKMQEKWDNYIAQKLDYYMQIFDKKKNRFVKLSESPSKDR